MKKLNQEAITIYRQTAQQRWKQEEKARFERQKQAWQVVGQAAFLLKEKFHASKVTVFGSLVHKHWFTETSDIDLAVWGLPSEDYFLAVAKLQDISTEFKIDVVRMENCPERLRSAIISEGNVL